MSLVFRGWTIILALHPYSWLHFARSQLSMVNYDAKILFVLILLRERDHFHKAFVTVIQLRYSMKSIPLAVICNCIIIVILLLVITTVIHLQIELYYKHVYVEIHGAYEELSTLCCFKHPVRSSHIFHMGKGDACIPSQLSCSSIITKL